MVFKKFHLLLIYLKLIFLTRSVYSININLTDKFRLYVKERSDMCSYIPRNDYWGRISCMLNGPGKTPTTLNLANNVPCGISKGVVKIAGGTNALQGEFPWQVSLQALETTKKHSVIPTVMYVHKCGGTILAANFVVTAAHCVYEYLHLLDRLSIVAGEQNLEVDEGMEQRSSIQMVYMHTQYKHSMPYENDIAVLMLSQPINLDGHTAAPICLPQPSLFLSPGTECVITGWGRLSPNGPYADKLQKTTVPIIHRNICDVFYQGAAKLGRCQLCAGSGGNDAREGDSGGPLVCQAKEGQYMLYGIVSFGEGQTLKVPTVYTEVSCYFDSMGRFMWM